MVSTLFPLQWHSKHGLQHAHYNTMRARVLTWAPMSPKQGKRTHAPTTRTTRTTTRTPTSWQTVYVVYVVWTSRRPVGPNSHSGGGGGPLMRAGSRFACDLARPCNIPYAICVPDHIVPVFPPSPPAAWTQAQTQRWGQRPPTGTPSKANLAVSVGKESVVLLFFVGSGSPNRPPNTAHPCWEY